MLEPFSTMATSSVLSNCEGDPFGVGLQSIGSHPLFVGNGSGKGKGIGTAGTEDKLTDKERGRGVDRGGRAIILLSDAKEFITGAVIGITGKFSVAFGT